MKKLFSFCIILALVVSVMPSVTYAAVHTWGERRPSGSLSTTWADVASDADGSSLVASNGRLYTSTNGGVNWTERQPAGNVSATWTVDSDSDGSNLIVGENSGWFCVY